MGIEANLNRSNLPGLVKLRVLDLGKLRDFSEPEYFPDLGVLAHTISSAAITLKDGVIAAGDLGWEDLWFMPDAENSYTEERQDNGLWLTTLGVRPAGDSEAGRAWAESVKKKRFLVNAMDADGRSRLIGTKEWPCTVVGLGFTVDGQKGRRIEFRCSSERQPYFCTAFWDREIVPENSDFSEEFNFDFF